MSFVLMLALCITFCTLACTPSDVPSSRLERLQPLVKQYDRNGNGRLDQAEREALRESRKIHVDQLSRSANRRNWRLPPSIVQAYDKDQDGELNTAERQSFQDAQEKDWAELQARYDKNENQRLESTEMEALREDVINQKVTNLPWMARRLVFGRSRRSYHQDRPRRTEFLKPFDRDGDGSLNESERSAASEAVQLNRLDWSQME